MSSRQMEIEPTTEAEVEVRPREPAAAEATPDDDLSAVLGLDRRSGRRRIRKRALLGAFAVVCAAGILFWGLSGNGDLPQYRTLPVERGDLTVTVTATGSLAPTNQVDVGSELSGRIESVLVNDNDPVGVGQILATLDTSRLEAQATQARASVESARAKVVDAEAILEDARLALDRARELFDEGLLSQRDLDSAQTAFQRAEAGLVSARAQVTQSQAALNAIETDLAKAAIHSPIDGVVLARNVEPGQTVAASFQSPVLFTLAQDLRRMELRVDVDEADVNRVREGQKATFTVDAHQDRSFPARVKDVRYASKTVQGVVTYEAVLEVDNSDVLLRPGMTATAEITVDEIADALLVPNAALRFSPPSSDRPTSQERGGLVRMLLPRPPRREGSGREPTADGAVSRQRVWTLRDGSPVLIPITVGPSDGTKTTVLSGAIEEGLPLLVDVVTSKS